jgi:hypothetical protein
VKGDTPSFLRLHLLLAQKEWREWRGDPRRRPTVHMIEAARAAEDLRKVRAFVPGQIASEPHVVKQQMDLFAANGPLRMNTSTFGKQEPVRHTSEIDRIVALPRRVWSEDAAKELAKALTKELRRPGGTQELRPVQAVCLYEAMQTQGLFTTAAVGAGKSLVFFLCPRVLDVKRCSVLFVPASLEGKTWDDYKMYAEHWYLTTSQQILSYESLGLVQNATKLDFIRPEMIGGDEIHLLKNRHAGRTRRVVRYMRERPETLFAAGSGTVHKGSIGDFAHILRWCLKDKAPIPETDDEVETWAHALDEKVNPLARRSPGAILKLGPVPPDATNDVTRARRVFQARLLQTPGVVASSNKDGVACSLRVSALDYKPAAITEQHVANMQLGWVTPEGVSYPAWTTPDGWTFSEALQYRQHVRELAMGFHSIWLPRPEPEWLAARRNWAVFVRETLVHSKTLDTELQVVNATDVGRLPESRQAMGEAVLADWRSIRDTFKIQPKPIWHDDSALQTCAKWMEREKGIVWTEHTFFALRLAQITGCDYYGPEGLNARGETITHVKPGRAIIASIQANGTGRNLQMFSANLITSCPPGASTIEQLIGRTHRPGQEADTVTVDVLRGCLEHHNSFFRAVDGARAEADLLGHVQKLLLADIVFPSIADRRGSLWV